MLGNSTNRGREKKNKISLSAAVVSEAFRGPFKWRVIDELRENEPCLGAMIMRHKYLPSEINPVNVPFSKYGHH